MTVPLQQTNLLTSAFTIPDTSTPVSDVLSRWSDANLLCHPAVIVTPETEQDVVAAVRFAGVNSLVVVAVGGGHGTCTAVDAKTLYLDLRNFKALQLNKEEDKSRVVEVGGGVLTGELVRYLANEGYITSFVGSNGVGVVGAILGGGHTSQAGLLGWVADNVLSFRLVTASGSILEVSSSSTDAEHRALFNALCGAGYGLGVITAVTIKAHPIPRLNLLKDEAGEPKFWSRTMVFPGSAIDDVAAAFLAHTPPPEPMSLVLLFARSPPGTPSAGAPTIILMATHFGPSGEAEASAAGASLSHPSLTKKAFMAETTLQPLSRMNDPVERSNVHGGCKISCGARLKTLTQDILQAAFARWQAITAEYPDGSRTMNMFQSYNPAKLSALGSLPDHKDRFVEARDRGFTCTVGTWCYEPGTHAALTKYLDETLPLCREADTAAGVVPRAFSNAMRFNGDVNHLFSMERLAELERLRKKWDVDGLFWNPYRR